ncbi:flavin reductase family protein [Sphingopyxis granuli]|uniref:flavin reductase family protein n=1 Tax=Sphingopyxis granuli TaxID=267128 RepID=UPI001F52F9ED|nr:flavin reductase family protein [Sphingopyxis granuli]UNK78228.1 flavin reductase family protein [Sphingopyxis granuli]
MSVAATTGVDAFRESMARLAATVHIVTAQAHGQRHGMTMTAACSLSVEPMSMILSIHRGSATHDAILASRRLCLNMLAPGDGDLATRFSGALGHRGEDRFVDHDWIFVSDAPPMLRNAAAALQCDVVEVHEFGTHNVLLCAVREVHLGTDSAALVYANRRYGAVHHPVETGIRHAARPDWGRDRASIL